MWCFSKGYAKHRMFMRCKCIEKFASRFLCTLNTISNFLVKFNERNNSHPNTIKQIPIPEISVFTFASPITKILNSDLNFCPVCYFLLNLIKWSIIWIPFLKFQLPILSSSGKEGGKQIKFLFYFVQFGCTYACKNDFKGPILRAVVAISISLVWETSIEKMILLWEKNFLLRYWNAYR